MIDNRFTWMHSGQIGSPQMDGVKLSDGQILKVLDAALVDGYNPQTAATATIVPNGVKLTYTNEHGYENKQIITIVGASDAKLNGRHRIIERTKNDIVVNAVGVSVVTGTFNTRVAPLGFESIFGNTTVGKRAYRSANLEGTRTVLYLDTTLPTGHGYSTTNPAKRAMVSICENMTTIGTEINSYTKTINAKTVNKNGSLFWYQARPVTRTEPTTSIEYRSWVIVGNGDIFYLFNDWQDWTTQDYRLRDLYAFGDATSLGGETDQYNCLWIGAITANDQDVYNTASTGGEIGGDIDTAPIGFFIKEHTGVGDLQRFVFTNNGYNTTYQTGSNASTYFVPTPNPVSASLLGFPLYALTKKGIRATIPKLLSLPHNLMNNIGSWDLVVTGDTLTVGVFSTRATTGYSSGFYAFDLGD